MKKTLFPLLGFLGLTTVSSSCGPSAQQETSKRFSLVGRPCQDYGVNLFEPRYHCQVFRGGTTRTILFDLQGFNDQQLATLKEALDHTARAFNDFWNVSQAPLTECVKKYTTRDWDPTGPIGVNFPELDRKIIWAMTAPLFNFHYHESNRIPVKIQAFDVPPTEEGSYVFGRAIIGSDQMNMPTSPSSEAHMEISMNRVALDADYFEASDFAGTIYHEWMHRNGWDHPNGYDGSLIKELGLCISRENRDKGLSLTFKPDIID